MSKHNQLILKHIIMNMFPRFLPPMTISHPPIMFLQHLRANSSTQFLAFIVGSIDDDYYPTMPSEDDERIDNDEDNENDVDDQDPAPIQTRVRKSNSKISTRATGVTTTRGGQTIGGVRTRVGRVQLE